MAYQKILVTLDGSKLSELALRHILDVARPGSHVHILSIVVDDYVLDASLNMAHAMNTDFALPNRQLNSYHDATDAKAIRARLDYLHETTDWLTEKDYIVTCEARPGRAVDEIVNVAREGFDMVIMATHGRTGLGKFVLGSVTEGVLHRSPCPVLIIPARSHDYTHN